MNKQAYSWDQFKADTRDTWKGMTDGNFGTYLKNSALDLYRKPVSFFVGEPVKQVRSEIEGAVKNIQDAASETAKNATDAAINALFENEHMKRAAWISAGVLGGSALGGLIDRSNGFPIRGILTGGVLGGVLSGLAQALLKQRGYIK